MASQVRRQQRRARLRRLHQGWQLAVDVRRQPLDRVLACRHTRWEDRLRDLLGREPVRIGCTFSIFLFLFFYHFSFEEAWCTNVRSRSDDPVLVRVHLERWCLKGARVDQWFAARFAVARTALTIGAVQ
jgi:hypothetical protein